MVERVCTLCARLGEDREESVRVLAPAVCERLAGELREGLKPDDCGEVFPLAAALLVLEVLGQGQGMTAFSVGEVSMRFDPKSGGGRTARKLLAPFLRPAFAVTEVAG